MINYLSLPDKKLIPELKKYFRTIFDIVDWTLEQAQNIPDFSIKEGFSGYNSPNPFYNAINFDGSIVLEYYYGSPSCFHTPMGKWNAFRGGCGYASGFKELDKLFKEKFGVVEIKPEVQINWGYIGGFYYLTKDTNGDPIPPPSKIPIEYGEIRLSSYEEHNKFWDEIAPEELTRTKNSMGYYKYTPSWKLN
jgi:hypothetical protein